MYKQIIPFLIFLLIPLQALAWQGRAIHISNGDTITVLAEDKQQVRIRLYGIDAPEMRQNFGRKSKNSPPAWSATRWSSWWMERLANIDVSAVHLIDY
jgi:endonuclease YncB( thermonuclease family)